MRFGLIYRQICGECTQVSASSNAVDGLGRTLGGTCLLLGLAHPMRKQSLADFRRFRLCCQAYPS